MGAGWFVLDRTLQWDPPEKYVETDKTLSAPRAVGPYQRGVSTLPKLPYDESDCVLLPAGDKSFTYKDDKEPSRAYSSILGCLIRAHFPGIVPLPSGGTDVAWTWKHYSYKSDPDGEFNNMQDKVQCTFWKYFEFEKHQARQCMAIVNEIAKGIVRNMHHEARVSCVRNWYADRKIPMTKKQARNKLLEPWQYMQVPPRYVGEDTACFTAMVAWWTCPQYIKKHKDAKQRREQMDGGSHSQGSLSLARCRQKEKIKMGMEPTIFGLWTKKRTRKVPHPVTGSMWMNKGSELRSGGYTKKYKELRPDEPDVDPLTGPFDPEAVVLAGEGKRNGRFWIGDGSIDVSTIPALRQIRRGRTSSQPAVETRPQPSVVALDEIRNGDAERRPRSRCVSTSSSGRVRSSSCSSSRR